MDRRLSLLTAAVALAAGGCGPAHEPSSGEAREGAEPAAPARSSESRPPGPAFKVCEAVTEGVSLAEMFERAELVVVGSVLEVGANAPLGSGSVWYQARLRIERDLRGPAAATLELTASACNRFRFEHGRSYLVFAERRSLGEMRVPAIVPVGYWQGVYPVVGDDRFANPATGEIGSAEIERRVGNG